MGEIVLAQLALEESFCTDPPPFKIHRLAKNSGGSSSPTFGNPLVQSESLRSPGQQDSSFKRLPSFLGSPRIHLLAISCLYDATCQVELRVASAAQRAWAARQDGCALVFSFTYPDTHSPKEEDSQEHVILAVPIWRLLPFLADCNGTEGVTVVQVFEFQET